MSKATNVRAEVIPYSQTGEHYERLKATPGAIMFYGDEKNPRRHCFVTCPCGCGSLWGMRFYDNGKSKGWTLSGPDDRLTARPSLGCCPGHKHKETGDVEADGYHWHGFLTDGVWVSC